MMMSCIYMAQLMHIMQHKMPSKKADARANSNTNKTMMRTRRICFGSLYLI